MALPVHAIIWDLDGTLANSTALAFEGTVYILLKNGYESITEEQYHAGTKFVTSKRLAWHAVGNENHPIGVSLGEQFDDYYVRKVSSTSCPLYGGIFDILDDCKSLNKLRMGVLSNACGAYVRAVCKENEVSDFLVLQYGADDVRKPKPAPDGILQCCELMKVAKDNCIYIGDSPSDGLAAFNAKMRSIGVTWGSNSKEVVEAATFTVVVSTMAELLSVIKSWSAADLMIK